MSQERRGIVGEEIGFTRVKLDISLYVKDSDGSRVLWSKKIVYRSLMFTYVFHNFTFTFKESEGLLPFVRVELEASTDSTPGPRPPKRTPAG